VDDEDGVVAMKLPEGREELQMMLRIMVVMRWMTH